MKPILVETIKAYRKLEARLRELGYMPYQSQYRWNDPNGLHVWFWREGHENIEVVTYNKDISTAIAEYRG